MSISIKSRKQKGRKLQQWVCQKVSDFLDIEWGYEDDKLIQPRILGCRGTDVILRGEAKLRFPFSIETKRTERISIPEGIRQAKKNQSSDTNYLLVIEQNKRKPFVVLDADVFFDIFMTYKKFIRNEQYAEVLDNLEMDNGDLMQ